jgi:serine/threonine protein kinase
VLLASGAEFSPSIDPETGLVGQVLGGTYDVQRCIETGGMATVYEAEHLRLHRRVAVKVLATALSSSPEVLARFQQEAQIMSQIDHPHVVTVLDFDVSARGDPYLVLELLHGESLADRLKRQSPLPLGVAVDIAIQIASGLAAAHRVAVIHRDLKPDNVFLLGGAEDKVFAKLLDFGISKRLGSRRHLTRADQLLGTPEYMAPEQAMGRADQVDARTDEYALAVVTYEMLTGEQPFAHDKVEEVLRRVINVSPPPPSHVRAGVPRGVDGVLLRALSKASADRFPSVTEFASALAAAAEVPVVSPTTPPDRTTVPHESAVIRSPQPIRTLAVPHSDSRLTASGFDVSSTLSGRIDKARVALEVFAITEAVAHAEAACELAERVNDPVTAALMRVSDSLLERVFLTRLGSLRRRVVPAWIGSSQDLSSRTMFLLSRLDGGMAVEDALDVASMPRVDALRRLVQLVTCGALRLE